MHRILFATANDTFLNATTVSFFTREYNHSQSSRALGWNTNDPTVYGMSRALKQSKVTSPDYGWNQTCGELSPTTFTHIGYFCFLALFYSSALALPVLNSVGTPLEKFTQCS